MSKEIKELLGEGINLYHGKGCDICNHTGFRGRTAIFEIIKMTPELGKIIFSNPSSEQVWQIASRQGTVPIFYDGLEKVKNGITTVEELLRVASPPKPV